MKYLKAFGMVVLKGLATFIQLFFALLLLAYLISSVFLVGFLFAFEYSWWTGVIWSLPWAVGLIGWIIEEYKSQLRRFP